MPATRKPSEKDALKFPVINDLAATLHFAPEQGHIWLAGRRMMLVHTKTLGILRREIVSAVGPERGRAILTRQGYEAGAMDAEIAGKVRKPDAVYKTFSVGPQLHALEGAVLVEPVTFEVDVEAGKFRGEYIWKNSSECAEHRDMFGIGHEAAGWGQIGYASGFASIFLGRPIVYREVECIAMGHAHCRIIGKPEEEWENPEDDLRYMRSDQFTTNQKIAVLPRRSSEKIVDQKWRMVGASTVFNGALDMLSKVAHTDAVVLFQGESGVGKEMFARNLHALSLRRDNPFVAVNCASLPDTLIEAELFGVQKGAYTGAADSRPGRFERAEGGTLFLDEIGTLSLHAQAKLLRALQEGEIERVGDNRTRKVDVRLIAATNEELREAVAEGRFRADLFYRLNVFPLRIAPLRERRADIPLLMDYFLNKYSVKYGKTIPGFEERSISAILSYDWPGNVRELENCIARAVIMADEGAALHINHLFANGERVGARRFVLSADGNVVNLDEQETAAHAADPLETILHQGLGMDEVERRLLELALTQANGNHSRAARILGLSRAKFNYRLGK